MSQDLFQSNIFRKLKKQNFVTASFKIPIEDTLFKNV